jgi:MerR family mercuric resistance operon transcriptional regulator
MAQVPLTIGRLACSAGVNVETVRYYQRRGLIIEPEKPAYGFRYYPAETVTRIQFIKRAQRLGFTLQEIGNLLDLGDGHCEDVHELAERKYSEIETQIADLLAMKKSLKRLLGDCETRNGTGTCPIVETFAGRNHRLAGRN